MEQKRIHLISSPRNISTALMYSFANRSDCRAFDEPLYAHYLKHCSKEHPGREEIMNALPNDANEVVDQYFKAPFNEAVLFFKNMAHHMIEMDCSYMLDMTNLFLIRNPKQLIASFSQVIESPQMEDIGSKRQYELYHELKAAGKKVAVLDSNELLKAPEKVLKELCSQLAIPFDEGMLKWEKGPIDADGVWAPYWYKNVHNSTHFEMQKTSTRELAPELEDLYNECLPYYNELFEIAIKA